MGRFGRLVRIGKVLIGVALLIAAFIEPFGIVPGIARREPFAAGRPASYWAKVIKAEYTRGKFTKATEDILSRPTSLPILKHCLKNQDEMIRAPAVYLMLGHSWAEIEPQLMDVLENDTSLEVQYQATEICGWAGRDALPAIPLLIDLARNGVDDVAKTAAHSSLWMIDEAAAREAGDWKEYSSPEFGFSIQLPGAMTRNKVKLQVQHLELEFHIFRATFAGNNVRVCVAESPIPLTSSDATDYKFVNKLTKDFGEPYFDQAVDINGYQARDLRFKQGGHYSAMRLVLKDNYIYNVQLYLPSAFIADEAISFCHNSFKLTLAEESMSESAVEEPGSATDRE